MLKVCSPRQRAEPRGRHVQPRDHRGGAMTKRSGVPEPLPEREEVARLQAVAEWIVEADQGTAPYWVGSEVEELHCKHYRTLPDERIARDGHRLRVRVRTDTAAVRTESAVEVVEEQD